MPGNNSGGIGYAVKTALRSDRDMLELLEPQNMGNLAPETDQEEQMLEEVRQTYQKAYDYWDEAMNSREYRFEDIKEIMKIYRDIAVETGTVPDSSIADSLMDTMPDYLDHFKTLYKVKLDQAEQKYDRYVRMRKRNLGIDQDSILEAAEEYFPEYKAGEISFNEFLEETGLLDALMVNHSD